jgi:membrane-bound metal-dependent hydrolase YbcI (DUF457 family)
MEHTGHQLTGYAAALLVDPLIPHPGPPNAIVSVGFVAIVGIGALLPDLDMPGTKASKLLGPVTWVLAWLIQKVSIIVFEATKTSSDRSGRMPGHRQLTHTALWGVLVSVATLAGVAASPASAWAWWAALAMFTGHFAHLWGDAITLGGIPLWAPFVAIDGKRWACVWLVPKPMRFRVGGHREKGRIKTVSRWSWVNIGEGVVTWSLAAVVGLLGAATLLAAGHPWWTMAGRFLAS